jgi:hypothetical protein
MPQTYRVKLSDGREFDVATEGGPPSEQDVLAGLGGHRSDTTTTGPKGSAVGRFVSNAAEMLNPVAAVEGVYNAVTSPVQTGKAILTGQGNQLAKARQAFKEGRYSEMVGHGAAAALPILGPIAADAGEQIGAGDVAGGLGKATGLLVPFGMADAVTRLGLKTMPAAVADTLDARAAGNVADVMAPKSSAKAGLRMTAKAKKIAPELVKDADNAAWSRAGLRENFEAQLEDAKSMLDEAHDARNHGKPIETKPILDALTAKRAELVAEPFDAARTDLRALDKSGVPLGEAQVPAPNRARVAVLDKAISEVKALGDIAPYDALRTIRQAYDGPAEVRYNPAVTPDFLANQSNAMASADVAGAIRNVLADADPTTAAANARYSLYKSATDITKAAEELEQAKPKVGRRIVAQLSGVIAGSHAGGVPGAIAGAVVAPLAESALSAAPAAIQLQSARLMTEMAKAIRGGNEVKFLQLKFKLRDLAKQSVKAGVIRETAAPAGQTQAQ